MLYGRNIKFPDYKQSDQELSPKSKRKDKSHTQEGSVRYEFGLIDRS